MTALRFIRDCFKIKDGSNFLRDWAIGVAVILCGALVVFLGWLALLGVDAVFGPTVGTAFLVLILISWFAGVYAWGRNAS